MSHHVVDDTPVGKTANVAVVNEKIGFELSTEVIVILNLFFREVLVDCIELDSALTAPVDGIVEQLVFTA